MLSMRVKVYLKDVHLANVRFKGGAYENEGELIKEMMIKLMRWPKVGKSKYGH
jgi:hypothetical protein